jgi:hypothetical protein
MTALQALEALKDNEDRLQEVPSKILEQDSRDSLRALMSVYGEDEQQRSNHEWLELIRKENNPLDAARLILDWLDDKVQGSNRKANVAAAAEDPYQSLTD